MTTLSYEELMLSGEAAQHARRAAMTGISIFMKILLLFQGGGRLRRLNHEADTRAPNNQSSFRWIHVLAFGF